MTISENDPFQELYLAVKTLIDNVKKRHPGEDLICPDMVALENLLEKYKPVCLKNEGDVDESIRS